MLLIITNRDDLTADFLITRLIELGKEYFRLNSEDLANADLSFSLDNDSLTRTIYISEKSVHLDSVTCVWYRRKLWAYPSEVIMPEQRRFVAGEIINLVEGLVADPSILWVNPIEAVSLAERKVYQLRLARQLGLNVPRTIISNNPEKLRSFYDRNNGNVICKPIFHGLYVNKEERAAVYTHRVKDGSLNNDVQLRACPTYLQQEVTKGSDIRITFIGKDVFPVEIYSEESKPLDWRQMKVPISYRPYDLSEEVEKSCRLMLNKLGISYGAFDFVSSADGQLYFLEVNPTGEWAWLENELGYPMRDAFIGHFGI